MKVLFHALNLAPAFVSAPVEAIPSGLVEMSENGSEGIFSAKIADDGAIKTGHREQTAKCRGKADLCEGCKRGSRQ